MATRRSPQATARLRRALLAVVAVLLLACSPLGAAGEPTAERDAVRALVATDAGLRPACRAAFDRATAVVLCDPRGRGLRLRAPGWAARRLAGAGGVRLAGAPLAIGQEVRVRARRLSRRAQLAVVVAGPVYARFPPLGRRRLVATLRADRRGDRVVIRLRAGRRTWRPVVRRRPAAPVPAPSPTHPPAATPTPTPTPPARLAIRECGFPAAEDSAGFDRLWGPERDGPGWTGGDVTFSAPLAGGAVVWVFGDSFVDHVDGGVRSGGLVRNSLVVQDGECMTTYASGTAQAPAAFVEPADPALWYWPADATVEDGHLHLLAWRMRRTGPGAWDFAVVGTDLVTVALPGMQPSAIQPLAAPPGVGWGSALLEAGERTYVYGIREHAGGTELQVARTVDDLEGPWEYRTADGWSADPAQSADLLAGISHQVSVLPDGDEFVLLTQATGLGEEILAYRAPDPDGPWTPAGTVARALPPLVGTFTYNAAAHPEIALEDGLLLSYNVNSVDPDAAMTDAAIYHPRFLTVPWPPPQRARSRDSSSSPAATSRSSQPWTSTSLPSGTL